MIKPIVLGLGFYSHTFNIFLLTLKFSFKLSFFFSKLRFFFLSSQIFFQNLAVFLKNSDVFKTQVFFEKLRVFLKTQIFIVLNNVYVIYLLTTIAGSKKMNKMALMIKMVLSVFCFILCLSRGTSMMPP